MKFMHFTFKVFVNMFMGLLMCNVLQAQISQENRPTFTQRQMVQDLDFITNLFEISYAPAKWKFDHWGWSLACESRKAKEIILKTPSISIKDFQRLIKNFCQTAKDYHVVPQFYSTEWATLPFHIQSADGKYFISFIEFEEINDPESFPLSVGDEVILFDKTPIADVVEIFRKNEIGSNYFETDQALAEFYLTTKFGSSGHDVPRGKQEITFIKKETSKPQVHSFDWDYQSELITEQTKPSLAKSLKKVPYLKKDLFHQPFMTPHYPLIKRLHADNNEPSDMLGAKKSLIPPLGTVLWESEENAEFHAYLFLIDDFHVGGYIRIPSYYVEGDLAASEFSEIIELFQEASDVLVIDQLNNGGGVILYLYALLAMLTDYELAVPQHRLRLTQEDVYYAIKRKQALESVKSDRGARKLLGRTFEGVVVNYNLVQNFIRSHQFIIDQWNLGKLFTDFCYIYGIEKIIPHPEVNYKKPILLLTNCLDFSAADFFPAIMQDNQRAKVMGARTAGAGGYIEKVSFPNLNGIEELDITASFSQRPNGIPIENHGVTPDIPYVISQNDLQNNYIEYKAKILQELKLLIPPD